MQQTSQQTSPVPSPTAYAAVSRDANSRVWESTSYQVSPSGQTVPQVHRYTELATGLCYQQNGQWLDSQEQINILPDGSAEAVQGQHQAYFPSDIYNGVIKLVTPDGLQLQSQPVGLSYDDGTNTVLIAELTNSVGELISSNQIIYTNAFAGIDADLLYTYKKSGFEQDVIFRQQLPTPEQFGLSSGNSRLQLLTEFFNPPNPVETSEPFDSQDNLEDTTLTFGAMQMVHGKAFLAGSTDLQDDNNQSSVCKEWTTVDGRTLLVEELPYQRISPQLEKLPPLAPNTTASLTFLSRKPSPKRQLPSPRLARVSREHVFLADANFPQKPGVIFDYITVNTTETNFTFQGDMTYYVNAPNLFYGTTVIEGGAIIKFNGSGEIAIGAGGILNCATAPYRPAIFTSLNDNTLGETISGSSGVPNLNDVDIFLQIYPANITVHDMRFRYGTQALNENSATTMTVRDCQFYNIIAPVYAYDAYLYNDLIGYSTSELSDVTNWSAAEIYVDDHLVAENVTADSGYAFVNPNNSGETMDLTNCLITSQSMTNGAGHVSTIVTNSVEYIPLPSTAIYQVIGGGNYYLTNGSPYRTNGTANIDPTLLADLAKKTTWPPVVYDLTNISHLGTLNITAPRDTNSLPDIGYHYDPLDYVFGGCDLSNNLTVATGVAVGWFEDNGASGDIGNSYGIALNNGANISFNGNATQPCYLVPFKEVQEGGNSNWPKIGWNLGLIYNGTSTNQEPHISANFVISTATYGVNTMQDRGYDGSGTFNNCEFYTASLTSYNEQSLDFTNCLFFRIPFAFWDSGYDLNFTFENCTFYNGGISMNRSGKNPSFWQIQNSSFDDMAIIWSDTYNGATNHTLFDYNAYNTSNSNWKAYYLVGTAESNKLETVGSTDVTVTNYNWETSSFGNFYLPTNSPVLSKGSTNANFLGLYHFTTQTNQIPDGANTVTIGYHYVATGTNGLPLDSNGDGIPDYLEDANGDGLVDNGETNWALAILVQPTNQTVSAGISAAISVTAEGVPPPAYQWYFNSNLVANATNSALSFADIQTNNSGYYFVVVTNNFGAITSSVATLTVDVDLLLDVDFSGRSASAETGRAAIGDSIYDFWNEYNQTNLPSGSLPNLSTAEGQVSQVGLLVTNLPMPGFNGSSDQMYDDYLSAPIGQTATLTITNLPPGAWNVYLYSDDSTFDLSAGTNYYGFQTSYDQPLSGFLWQPGVQYIAFETVCVSNGEPVTIDVYYGENLSALISGLQIASANHNPSGFSGPVTLDSDYDGVSDQHELIDRTDPYNPNSVLDIELGSWSFDNTTSWIGDQGQLPLLATNIVSVPSWSTNAVQIDTNKFVLLSYRDVETNGDANINLRNGTVCFWFRPDWSSTDQGGTGPGGYGRLIEMGSYNSLFTNGWWSIYLSSGGTQLLFSCSTNGGGATNFIANVSWISNIWHQVVVTYTPTNSLFYSDGQFATNGAGSIYYPNVTERAQGFHIGGDTNGQNQARGAFDLLQTFNYPLSASQISSNYQAAVQQDSDGDGLPDIWEMDYFGHLGVNPTNDSTGDELDNAQDAAAGFNPTLTNLVRLGYWRFNNAPSWEDDQSLGPSIAQGLFPIPDWSGDAVEINSGSSSMLGYPGIRSNGVPVIACPSGSIGFWFKPDWNGVTVTNSAGGPGSNARLFEIGRETSDASYGWFGLTINPLGTSLTLATEAGGVHTNVLQAEVPFNSHTWYQVVLTYSPSATALYLNGQLVSSGGGLTCVPPSSVVQQGFYFGSSWDGTSQANGRFDELQTYNYSLAATNVAANYAAAMAVSAVDGLPVTVKDGWGLRSDVVNSVCDGLPDWWMLAMGFNPYASNNTSQLLQEYASGVGSALPQYQLVNTPSNLINIDFTAGTAATESSLVHGPTVAGFSYGDQWNFCNMQTNYLTNGFALNDSGSNQSSVVLHAYIGPCTNYFLDSIASWMDNPISPHTPYYETTTLEYDFCGYLYATNENEFLIHEFNVYDPSYNASAEAAWFDQPTDVYPLVYDLNGDWELLALLPTFIPSSVNNPSWWAANVLGPLSLDTLNPFAFYYNSDGSDGPYFSLSTLDQNNLNSAVAYSTSYAQWLGNYVASNSLIAAYYSGEQFSPFGVANCFVPAFSYATNVVLSPNDNPMLGDGLAWNYANTPTSVISTFYPNAKRTLLVSGLSPGEYGVYVYYDCLVPCLPAVVNGVASSSGTMSDGKPYWYCQVGSEPCVFPASFNQSISATIPPSALVSNTDYIQIVLDSPQVLFTNEDLILMGMQIVRLSNTDSTLSVRPGNDAAYLTWQPVAAATNYNILQAAGSTNTWNQIGSTNGLAFQVTNLTAGTTYFYMVQSVAAGSTNNSAVQSVIPFDCPEPLPPRIDYVNPLQLTAQNNTFEVPYSVLLTNSDAFDPQGYPLVFEASSVDSGSLTINGSPFNINNCTINTNTSVIWTPPPALIGTNEPAFTVYVYDGVNRSTNVVNVFIKQQPQTHLFGWGNYEWGTMGNGVLLNWPQPENCGALDTQATYFETPRDPRWEYYNNAFCYSIGDADSSNVWQFNPQQVLDINSFKSLSMNFWGIPGDSDAAYTINAVSGDGHLYSWGEGLGINWGNYYLQTGQSINNDLVATQWDGTLNGDDGWNEIDLSIPSPRPFEGVLSNVVSVCSHNNAIYVSKSDGSVWSWGPVASNIGRTPQSSGDSFGGYGMVPGQVPINDKIVELHADDPAGPSVIARGQDGQIYWWGEIDEPDGTVTWLAGNNDPGQSDDYHNPNLVTSLSLPGAAPIIQISVNSSHYVFLRRDGTVSELGYIPSLDTNTTWQAPEGFEPSDVDPSTCYQNTPVTVSNLPPNIIQVSAALSFGAALTADGNVWVWGNTYDATNPAPHQITSLKDIVKIAAGNANCVFAIDKQGLLWGWGFDDANYPLFGLNPADGQGPVFDDGIFKGNFYSQAVQIPNLKNVQDIAFLSPNPQDASDTGIADNMVFAVGSTPQGQATLLANPANQAVQLSWAGYPGASYYVVYRSLNEESGYAAIGRTVSTTFFDGNPPLQNGQTYYYEVSAVVNGVETGQTEPVSATPLPAPTAVQNLAAADECRDVLLTWSAPTNSAESNPQEYLVERATSSSGPFTVIGYCPAGTTAYEDSAAVAGQIYYYQVVPVNSAGTAISATVAGMLNPAAGLLSPTISTNWSPDNGGYSWFTITANGGGSSAATMDLYWTAPTDGVWLYTTNDDVGDYKASGQPFIQYFVFEATSQPGDILCSNLWYRFDPSATNVLAGNTSASLNDMVATLIQQLNNIIQGPSLYGFFLTNCVQYIPQRAVVLEQQLQEQISLGQTTTAQETNELNRMLLDSKLNEGYQNPALLTGPSWGTNVQFSIETHYMLANGNIVEMPNQVITLSQAELNASLLNLDATDKYACYGFSAKVPQGVQWWASVSAITNGQQGASSIEVGPLTSDPGQGQWPITPNAVPGYHQVYLDWPNDYRFYLYTMYCSAIDPGQNPQSNPLSGEEEVVLATNLTSDRYWHMELTPTNFTIVDFKYVGDFLSDVTNPTTYIASNIWDALSSAQQSALITNDIISARTNLATDLTSLIQGGTLLFNPYDTNGANMQPADLSTETKTLLGQYTNSSLNSVGLATLNRLLLEDAYVHDIARYETPTNGEFVSGDLSNPLGICNELFYLGSPIEITLWNDLPGNVQDDITNYVYWSGSNTNAIGMQRELATALNGILQTNTILFSTNDVVADSLGGISPRTLQFYSQYMTNEFPLLNRLLLQDAWWASAANVEPLSDLRYYWIVATYCGDNGVVPSYWVGARPNDQALPPPSLSFTASATPMSGMISVQWNVPGGSGYASTNSSAWQFSLARNGNDCSPFTTILQTGFGLSYLDSDVTNGLSYKYQVTAFDTNYNQYVAVTSPAVSPTNASNFSLLPPQAGGGYVDLTWTPIPVEQYNVLRSTSPNGPFTLISGILPQYEALNAQNTYEDTGVQNGRTYYYQIQAITPTGYPLNSQIESATPSTALPPLPPGQFQAEYVPNDANGQIILTWNPQNGAQTYQLFLVDQSRLTPVTGYNGVNTSYTYEIPWGVSSYNTYTFAIRSVNAQGMAGDTTEATIQIEPPSSSPTTNAPVILQVGGSLTNLTVYGPTNLAIIANVNVPLIKQVDFYSDDGDGLGPQLIGSGGYPSYQMTWHQVPRGTHTITAIAYAVPSTIYTPPDFYSSAPISVSVNIQSLLSAYQTSVTDLQLPAPALPISLSRSYNSRITSTNSALGIGWSPSWAVSSLTLTTNLDRGWIGFTQTVNGGTYYFMNQSVAHYETVTLPNGQSVSFNPQLVFPDSAAPTSATITNQALTVNEGILTNGNVNVTLSTGGGWNNVPISVDYTLSPWTYVGPDGTQYQFGKPVNNNMQWLLTQVTDLSGNSLSYVYDSNDNLLSVSNSCGRAINFSYVQTASGTNIEVFDAIGGTYASLIYQISNNCLVQVRQLQNRTTGMYLTNSYAYGSNPVTDTNDFNRLTQVYDARGIEVLQNSYTNGDGDLVMQISPGETNVFSIDASNDVFETSISSTATNTTEVLSDDSGAIAGATLPASGTSPSATLTTQNGYDDNGLLTSQTDANGNSKNYYYDNENRLTGQSDQDGNSTSQQLDPFGRPMIATDANGNQTIYEYDAAENPIIVNDPSQTTTSYTYSSPVVNGGGGIRVGELQTSQNENAPEVPYTIVTTNAYDVNSADPIVGDLLQTTEEWVDSGNNVIGTAVTTIYTYDANGNHLTQVTSRTVNGGLQYITNSYTYDALNRLTMTVISAGGSETLAPQTNTVTYNELGKQASSTDAAGRMTTNVYDFNGNLIETEYPDGTVSRTFYNGFNQAVYTQDRTTNYNGTATAPATYNVYDASGRVIQSGRSDGVQLTKYVASPGVDFPGTTNEIEYKLVLNSTGTLLTTNLTFYDTVGNVQYSVSERGAVTQNQYDPAGRLTNTLVYTAYTFILNGTNLPSPTGPSQSTSYTYDPNGNQLTVTDARGNTTTSIYNEANQLTEVDEPTTGGVTYSKFTYYDGLGRKIQSVDEGGIVTGYTYDFRGLLTSVTLGMDTPQSATTVYGYDEVGNQVSQTDANGHTTSFHYDALGRRTGRTLPGNQSESLVYDLKGDEIYHTNFNDIIITNQYDIDDHLTNCSSAGYHTSYAYSATGLRTNMVDSGGVTAFSYDDLAELTNKTVAWNGGPAISLRYGYDLAGTVTNIESSTANGVNLAYQYDILGRLTNVIANGNSIATYGYDMVGSLQAMLYGNGVTNLYQYDTMNRLTNLVWNLHGTPLASFAYNLGAMGNRLSLLETMNGTGRYYGWNYDSLYRLTNEVMHGATEGDVGYGYDVVGNRTNRTSSVAGLNNQAPVYNADDWMTNSDKYDNDGNTTNSSGIGYVYDAMDHLTNVNSGQILLTYDGDGNRVGKKVNGTNTYFLVDDENPSGYAQVLEEWTSTGTPVLSKVYNYGSDLISQVQPNVSTNYFIVDGHGSTRMLTDNGGNIANVFVYDAFGNLIASNGVLQTAYLYAGQQYDSELELYYNRARYLNTGTGRFWMMDTYEGDDEEPSSLHKYLYCNDNTVNCFDSSGHDAGVLWSSLTLYIHKKLGSSVSVPLKIKVVGDAEIDTELKGVYDRMEEWAKDHGPILTEPFWGAYYPLMRSTRMDTRFLGEANFEFQYHGQEHPLLWNKTFIYTDLNYIGVGVGFAARGYGDLQISQAVGWWNALQHEVQPSMNTYSAAYTGYYWYNENFKK